MRQLLGAALLACSLAACTVMGTLPGEVAFGGPQVVVQPPVYHWHWSAWPHYDVVHQYVLEDQPVYVEHHHYYPFYDRFDRDIRHDNGRHEGWYKHHGERDHSEHDD